jgi:hypothetical protein
MKSPKKNAISDLIEEAGAAQAPSEIETPANTPEEVDRDERQPHDARSEGLGQSLANKEFHPVLIFGTAATGKTTFLTSMLSFFTSVPDVGVTITLGDPISNTEVGRKAHESSEKLFHLQVNNYLTGIAPVQNQEPFPFFVPVELRRRRNRELTRIALMESSGELWSVTAKKNFVQELREEILDVYKNYPYPITVIMVVPYAMSEGYTGEDPSGEDKSAFQASDNALHQTLQVYQRNRPPHIGDSFYFVLTKWDMHVKVLASDEFLNPDDEVVRELVRERFPRAFGHFENMADEDLAQCTPYSAGLIGGTRILEVPKSLKPALDEFPYRLWRWIYANATNGRDLYMDDAPQAGSRIGRFFRGLFS